MPSYKLPESQVLRQIGITTNNPSEDMFYDTLRHLSSLVVDYRKKNNLTNRQLAEKLGITTSVMSRIESGNQNLSLKTICRVLAKINATIKIETADEHNSNQ